LVWRFVLGIGIGAEQVPHFICLVGISHITSWNHLLTALFSYPLSAVICSE
jgi:hypothetical protein